MESCVELRALPLAEEPLQMGGLNKRLEAYLARVKFLEEENEALKAQLRPLRGGPPDGAWRGQCEEELAALRAALEEACSQKHAAELARAGLQDEARQVRGRCQRERAAREEARRLLAAGRQALEEEKRGHLWLRERAAQLQTELRALAEAHEEERAALAREVAAGVPRSPQSLRRAPRAARPLGLGLEAEAEDYGQRLAGAWRGAVETYQAEVSQLEAALRQSAQSLGKAAEGNRQDQLQLQRLERDLAGLRGRKEALEERLAQQWQHQQGEAGQLQLAVEGLEEEKRALRVQIAQVLEDRQQLMHLKMSLSLEVATYRTLLEAESTRLQTPAEHKLAVSLQDGKWEASSRICQAASLEREHLGSRDPRPSAMASFKRGAAPQLPKNPSGPCKSGSPTVREFQEANTALQPPPPKAVEGAEAPAFIGPRAFKLGSSLQTEAVAATVSQSFIHESSPLFDSIRPTVPNGLGEPGSNSEQSHLTGEDGGEVSAETEAKELGEKEVLYAEEEEEEEEEEKQPSEEPPWKAPVHDVPYPSQLVTEALETALQDVQGGGARFEAGLLDAAEAPNGIPSDDSSSTEEDNGTAASSTAALEEATPKRHKSQMEGCPTEDLLEGVKGFEDSGEASACQEVRSEQQEEAEVSASPDTEPSSPRETEVLEEEGDLSTQRNTEEFVFDIPVVDETDCSNKTRAPEVTEGGDKQLPDFQSIVQRGELGEASRHMESAARLDKDAAAISKDRQESSGPGASCPEDHSGADLEEADGGAEDLEVLSTEALHLSEDEERGAFSSPSRESGECDCQAEMLEGASLQTEEFATEMLSPGSHSVYSAGRHQGCPFLGAAQEPSEEETPLYKTGSALPEEEGNERDPGGPEASGAEEAVLSEGRPTQALASKPWATEQADAEEEQEPQPGDPGHRDLLEGEDALGKEDTVEKKELLGGETARLPEGTWEQAPALRQEENVQTVPWQETSEGEQRGEACQGALPAEEKAEVGEIPVAAPENGVLEREGLRAASGAIEAEETETGAEEEEEEMADCVPTGGDSQEKDSPEAQQLFTADTPQAEEEHLTAEREEADPSPHPLPFGQSLLRESGPGAPEVPSEVPGETAGECEAESHRGPRDVDGSSESDRQRQSDDSGSEGPLESLDVSPNASCETERIDKELGSSRQVQLEETLPDSTPLHLYDEKMPAVTGTGQLLPESQEAAETASASKEGSAPLEAAAQAAEGVCPGGSLAENDEAEVWEGADEESDDYLEPAPKEDAPDSEEPPISEELEETKTGTSELSRDGEDPPSREADEPSREECFPPADAEFDEQPGEVLEQGSGAREEPARREMLHEGNGRTDVVWEAERDNVFQAEEPHPSSIQEGVRGGDDRPFELSGPNNTVPEGPHKVSPLTSVADLGEIVLEEEQPRDGQKDGAASEGLEYYEDKSLLRVRESQLISDGENCGGEDPSPQADLSEISSSGQDFTDPLLNAQARLPIDNLKDSEILEIVEQALEFNEEFIKAAEQTVEAEQPAARSDPPPHFPEEESNGSFLALPDDGRSQVFAETPNAASPSARDPPGSGCLWDEEDGPGQQQDSSLADFSSEILNGQRERAVGSFGEELVEGLAASPHTHREGLGGPSALETTNQSPAQTLANEEAPGTGEISPATHENVPLEQSGQEGLCVGKSLFANMVQSTHVKGKDAETETVSIPPQFGEEILRLESSQHLKFRPEEEEEFWSPEDH
ncbi:nestin [Eublepharis macularius]|uniref:Nestin n=1 Tax=Eublepharis macularius TaxID=481883 RepID=A0AA97KUA4_EUBMA|nr:nestin [Eublepharis macularius]